MRVNFTSNSLLSIDNCFNRNIIYVTVHLVLVNFLILTGTPVFSQNRLSQLVQNSKPSVFSIITYDNKNNPLAYGTGFFIDSKGTGITNYHVLEGANSALIKTLDGNHYQINNIISQSKKMDIIKFSIENEANRIFPYLKLCQSQPIEAEDVFVIGNPKELEYSVSNGIISSVRNIEDLGKIVQTTAPISSGNSGSPLINMKGEVLGVISFTLLEGQNLNFAISVSNFTKMESINKYLFPSSVENTIIKNESIFKRFEWKTSSSEILQKETMTFVEKKRDSDGNFNITYYGVLASIDIKFSYTFLYDELNRITISPLRTCPYNPNDKDWPLGDSLEVIVNEYLTFQKKMIKVLGENFTECAKGNHSVKLIFCSEDYEFNQDKSTFIISEDSYLTCKKVRGYREVNKRWKNIENNTKYELRIYNFMYAWNMSLNITPIED
jgi:hypothetical protein